MIYSENILICIALPLLISVLFAGRNTRRLILSFLVGACTCLAAAYISGFIQIVSGLDINDTSVFISPVVEEIMKLLPLLFYLFLFEPDDRILIQISLGLGTGFATFENCCYILSLGAEKLTYILIRGMAVGVMHIISILALGLGIVLARRFKALSAASILGALSLSATFHALYNLLVSEPGVSSAVGYVLPVLTAVLLYVPYRRIGLHDIEIMDP